MKIEGLLASQVEQLGREVGRAGLDPREFHSEETDNEFAGYSPVPAIFHQPTGSYFAFARYYRSRGYSTHLSDEGHAVGFAPGTIGPFEKRGPLEWVGVSAAFREWLGSIKRENATQDVWSLAPSEFGALDGDDDSDTTFSPTEQLQLKEQLNRIEEMLANAARGHEAAVNQIRVDIAELRKEVTKMQRGKWKKYAVGTLVSLASKHVVPPDMIQHAAHMLRDFFSSGGPLLPP